MSQKAVMIRINGVLHREVFNNIPDYDEAIQICKDVGYKAAEGKWENDYILLEYEWLDIGDGESGADTFYDDDLLLDLYDTYGFEEIFEKQGHAVDSVESGSYEILYEELDN